MKKMESISIRFDGDSLFILDQQMLPGEETWVSVEGPDHMVSIIQQLKVRGAPLIGVAAVLSLATFVEGGASEEQFKEKAQQLRLSRPTAVNLMICIDRLLAVQPFAASSLVATAEQIFDEDVKLCAKMAVAGASIIENGDVILTHCNTGGLATVGCGTALGVIGEAHRAGKKISVFVDETRPLLQGGRLTTWELKGLRVPYQLICDNMAGQLMSLGKVSKIFVGSDRIARNGDFANKIGTYSLAVLAHYHRVPFYVVAPSTTVDLDVETGADIPIEQRRADEVRGVQGSFGKIIWSPEDAQVYNPSFDVTPAEIITGFVIDDQIISSAEAASGAIVKYLSTGV